MLVGTERQMMSNFLAGGFSQWGSDPIGISETWVDSKVLERVCVRGRGTPNSELSAETPVRLPEV